MRLRMLFVLPTLNVASAERTNSRTCTRYTHSPIVTHETGKPFLSGYADTNTDLGRSLTAD